MLNKSVALVSLGFLRADRQAELRSGDSGLGGAEDVCRLAIHGPAATGIETGPP
jgi:hypothetical protein